MRAHQDGNPEAVQGCRALYLGQTFLRLPGTRIPTGETITAEKLARTEQAENYLFSLGFTDFRVRSLGNTAKLQLPADQLEKLLAHRLAIVKQLKTLYTDVLLDLEARHE